MNLIETTPEIGLFVKLIKPIKLKTKAPKPQVGEWYIIEDFKIDHSEISLEGLSGYFDSSFFTVG